MNYDRPAGAGFIIEGRVQNLVALFGKVFRIKAQFSIANSTKIRREASMVNGCIWL